MVRLGVHVRRSRGAALCGGALVRRTGSPLPGPSGARVFARLRALHRPHPGDFWALGAEGWTRTSTPLREGDFKAERKGRRIEDFSIRRPFPFTRVTRSALQSEGYGDTDGHTAEDDPWTIPIPRRHGSRFSENHIGVFSAHDARGTTRISRKGWSAREPGLRADRLGSHSSAAGRPRRRPLFSESRRSA